MIVCSLFIPIVGAKTDALKRTFTCIGYSEEDNWYLNICTFVAPVLRSKLFT